jgi:hypothetical protein
MALRVAGLVVAGVLAWIAVQPGGTSLPSFWVAVAALTVAAVAGFFT